MEEALENFVVFHKGEMFNSHSSWYYNMYTIENLMKTEEEVLYSNIISFFNKCQSWNKHNIWDS